MGSMNERKWLPGRVFLHSVTPGAIWSNPRLDGEGQREMKAACFTVVK